MGASMNRRIQQQQQHLFFPVTTINMDRSSVTQFEDLSNEIIFLIFNFLDMYHIYNAFSNLNNRLQNLVDDSTFPVDINMAFLSKSNFQRYYTYFIRPNNYRIRSLRLLNSFMFNLIFSSIENTEQFIELETLVIDNVISQDFLYRLISLPNLSSLIINQSDHTVTEHIYCHSIVRLPRLKYCKISCKAKISFESSLNTLNESNSMEHLIINNEFDLNQLSKLLSCFPCLHRLSIDSLYFFRRFGIPTFSNRLNQLTHVSLQLKNIKFDQFESFIIHLFHHLQVLQISTDNDKEYLNAVRWERVISFHMIHLRIFDIQHLYSVRDVNDQWIYDDLISQFTSLFWLERQWYFGYQHPEENRSQYGLFYSIQPYRRRYYALYTKHNQHCSVISDYHSVRHVHIQNELAINDCSFFFSNAVELTIHRFHEWNTSKFNRIIPLERLDKIIINSNYSNITTLMKILYSTPNCSQLILNHISPDMVDLISIQNNTIFRSISNVNRTKDITVKSTCPLKQIKLLVILCSRLEHLTISVLERELTSTIEYLLINSNKHTRHLASVSIQSTKDIDLSKLVNQLKTLKQSNEFAVQEIGRRNCHIWW